MSSVRQYYYYILPNFPPDVMSFFFFKGQTFQITYIICIHIIMVTFYLKCLYFVHVLQALPLASINSTTEGKHFILIVFLCVSLKNKLLWFMFSFNCIFGEYLVSIWWVFGVLTNSFIPFDSHVVLLKSNLKENKADQSKQSEDMTGQVVMTQQFPDHTIIN